MKIGPFPYNNHTIHTQILVTSCGIRQKIYTLGSPKKHWSAKCNWSEKQKQTFVMFTIYTNKFVYWEIFEGINLCGNTMFVLFIFYFAVLDQTVSAL